ncbi:MAG: hypothetical protein OXU66_06445 [Gammaproteobacteria bacterium]|nr:hypothetical protein [Gammaproteobacteria bacterium]MDD9894200.1 hypothetical protein [Gammaproteobacteria bacterium]MDD9958566.1 hypothetical protein [Gammaproteobacteria bacterium]
MVSLGSYAAEAPGTSTFTEEQCENGGILATRGYAECQDTKPVLLLFGNYLKTLVA